MDAWSMIVRLVEEELIERGDFARAETLVRSAAVARLAEPREMVAAALLERLEAGVGLSAALDLVEDLIVARHNLLLIAVGRGGGVAETDRAGRIVRWARPTPDPTFAA